MAFFSPLRKILNNVSIFVLCYLCATRAGHKVDNLSWPLFFSQSALQRWFADGRSCLDLLFCSNTKKALNSHHSNFVFGFFLLSIHLHQSRVNPNQPTNQTNQTICHFHSKPIRFSYLSFVSLAAAIDTYLLPVFPLPLVLWRATCSSCLSVSAKNKLIGFGILIPTKRVFSWSLERWMLAILDLEWSKVLW